MGTMEAWASWHCRLLSLGNVKPAFGGVVAMWSEEAEFYSKDP